MKFRREEWEDGESIGGNSKRIVILEKILEEV
jgi:hypothetical protein